MKIYLIPILFLLAAQSYALDRWGAFSRPFPIHDVAAFSDGVMLATEGGIRFRNQALDYVYHSEHGLETSNYYSVVSSAYGLLAVSEYGIIVSLDPDGQKWHVLSRSFVKNNVRAVPGAAELGKNILVIAFEDRLAFFDIQKKVSLLTIDRLGGRSLSADPIKKMAIHGDSLYLQTAQTQYVRVLSWDSLASDVRLNDPSLWIELSQDIQVDEFETMDSTRVEVDGKSLTDAVLFDGETSRITQVVKSNSGYYLVGPTTLIYFNGDSSNPQYNDLSEYNVFLLGETYELRASPQGGVYGASVDGKIGSGNLYGWNIPWYAFGSPLGSLGASYSSRIKVLSVLPDGYVFFHIWGLVYQIYSDWGNRLEYAFTPTDGLCFDSYLEETPYSISSSVVPAPDNSGFLTASASKNGYSIVYFNKNGDVRCAKNVGKNSVPQSIFAKVGDDGQWWIYVSGKNGTTLAHEGELELFKFPPPKSNGGELDNFTYSSYRGITPAPLDMVYDSRNDRLWLVSMASLGYLDDSQDSLISPSSTRGLQGAEYTSIDIDVHGNLWLGTANQGVYRLTQKGKTPDTLSVKHFTAKDGLLSDNVADVAIDGVYGVAWFAHEKGVSYYQRNDLKDAGGNLTDSAKVRFRAYPVPFRPKEHRFFVIEGFTEDAVVSIYNRGGALIRAFKNGEVSGGRLEWNGQDRNGNLVAPGVYYYVVNNGPKLKKGKFIIVH